MNIYTAAIYLLFTGSVFSERLFSMDYPKKIPTVREEMHENITINFTAKSSINEPFEVEIISEDSDLVLVVSDELTRIPNQFSSLNPRNNISVVALVKGVFISYAFIRIRIKRQGTGIYNQSATVDQKDILFEEIRPVNVLRSRRGEKLSKAFTIVMIIVVAINNFLMGTQLDVKIIKETVKKPIGPVIGFCTQFLLMPLIAYGWGWAVLSDWPTLQLGYFAMGCSPGGGASNFWTILFDGNIDLSVTMTFFSNFAAFFMMPLWLYSLTRTFYPEFVSIPFINILGSLAGLIIPACIGLAFITWKPEYFKKCRRLVKCFTLVILLVIFCFGFYANLFIFLLMRWYTLLAGFLLPWTGYALAFGVAYMLRQNMKNCLTIAIETGIQNGGIAIVLLKFSLEEPDSDLSLVMPICTMIFTTSPLWLILAGIKIKKRWFDKKDEDQEESNQESAKSDGKLKKDPLEPSLMKPVITMIWSKIKKSKEANASAETVPKSSSSEAYENKAMDSVE